MGARFSRGRFINDGGAHGPHASLRELLRWQLTRSAPRWERSRSFATRPAPPAQVRDGIRVTNIGHATLLIQQDGLNILTDPVWSERASPLPFVGPRRVRPPGVRFEDLPRIDLVVLSHNHYDHLDLATLQRLHARFHPKIITPLRVGELLRRQGIGRVVELDWWEHHELRAGLRVSAVPARHFSGRGLRDRDRTLWAGFVLQGEAGNVYFAGDTGFGRHFADIRDRLGPMDVALLPIGAYLPRWFMKSVHIDPAEAVQAARILEAQISVPIHYGTFPLADDEPHAALQDLDRALQSAVAPRPSFVVLDPGEGRTFGSAAATSDEAELPAEA